MKTKKLKPDDADGEGDGHAEEHQDEEETPEREHVAYPSWLSERSRLRSA